MAANTMSLGIQALRRQIREYDKIGTPRVLHTIQPPSIGQEEIEEVVSTLNSGWLTTGPKTASSSVSLRAYVQAPHCSCRQLCNVRHCISRLRHSDIGPGDEVITTPLTFCATVNTILHVGATPVLADVGDDGNIDPGSIEERLTDERAPSCRSISRAAMRHGLRSGTSRKRRAFTSSKMRLMRSVPATKVIPSGRDVPETDNRSDAVCFSFLCD